MLNWPNRITLFRIFSIPLFVFLLLEHKERYNSQNIENLNELRWAAFGVFVLAVISDGLDGMIARLKQQKTLLGTILDPVADKLLLMSATIILSLPMGLDYKIPTWLAVGIISRDIVILLGALLVYLMVGKLKFLPHYLGKLTTFFQMATILVVLLQWKVSVFSFFITFIFTMISGINYVYRETKVLNSQKLQ